MVLAFISVDNRPKGLGMTTSIRHAVASALLLGSCISSWASPIYISGYDASANKTVNASAAPAMARNLFESTLGALGTLLREDFEGMTVPAAISNQSPIAYSFGTITGNSIFPSNENLSLAITGVFNTTAGATKKQFIDTTGSVTISFAQALSGFGLYLTDLGDFQDSLVTVQLVTSTGVTLSAQDLKRGGSDADLLFWGFYDLAPNAYYSSVIITSNGGGDVYGMDDFVGVIAPRINQMPEPSTAVLLLAGLAGCLMARRRR